MPVQPYDLKKMTRNFGDRNVTAQVLVSYADQLKTQLSELRAAIDTGQAREIHRIAHSIRGGAQNIYNVSLGKAAREIEGAALPENGNVETLYANLEREVLVLAESVAYQRNKGIL